jgi:alkaline phosphatase D
LNKLICAFVYSKKTNAMTIRSLPKLTRRRFLSLTAKGIGIAIVSQGLMACSSDDDDEPTVPVTFTSGVASGDPSQDAVILWTRAAPQDASITTAITISWEVAEDQGFSNIVTNGSAQTNAEKDYTLKVDAQGLSAGTQYFYRFMSGDSVTEVGTTKTLPEGAVASAKIAVMSCSNYPAGYFNVYDMAAQDSELDAVLHLGDYIYEYGLGGYASENAASLGREVLPTTEILSLDDYRMRYAQYRSDESLQALHRQVPFICVWDDHEITNDAYRDGAENHQANEGDYEARKVAALQAYFEWMPIRPVVEGDNEIINRSFQFGDLIDLIMLDTRLVGRDQQLDLLSYIDPVNGQFNTATFTADVSAPSRTLLGASQLQWTQDQLLNANGRWQVLGQQVLMGRMNLPGAIVTQQLSIPQYAELGQIAILAQRAAANDPTLTANELAFLQASAARLTPEVQDLLALPSIPYNLDAWDGYAAERELILATAKQLGSNLVILAGDTHNAWANNIRDLQGDIVAVEFATSSVSSPGLESFLGIAPEAVPATEAGIVSLVDDLQYLNGSDRGYMTLTFSTQEVISEWRFVDTINSSNYQELTSRRKTLKTIADQLGITEV